MREKVAEIFAGKEIWIGEVGWPSEGRMRDGALPSPANQALVLSGVVEAARAENWKVNLIEAFDQPWKRLLEGTVGGYWGLFDDSARELKFRWGEPVSNHPKWRIEAALGIGAALLVLPLRGSRAARTMPAKDDWGRDLAIAAIALSAGLVFGWAALGLPMEPPEPGDRLRSAGMIVLSLLVPMLAARRGGAKRAACAASPWRSTRRFAGKSTLGACCSRFSFAATLVAAIHVALGLVFDPRYKDFQLASADRTRAWRLPP